MKALCLLALLFSFPLYGALLSQQMTSELMDKAIEGQKNSYAPYSHYYVGAAVLTKSGKIYSGCNVENASYGLGNCAERTAIFKAVSDGHQDLEAVVVVTRDGGMPCGACRQVLNEFNSKMIVIAIDENRNIRHETTLDQLLPHAFGPANLTP
jgi:cytidine deaminase